MIIKKFPILFCIFSIWPLVTRAQEAHLFSVMQRDTQAIRLVLEAETKDFLKMPLADLTAKYWLMDSLTQMAVSLLDGAHFVYSNELLSQATQKIHDQEVYKEFHKSNYNIYWHGNSAFVTNDQYFVRLDNTKVYSYEMRVMKKVNGEWKIHLSSVHQFTPPGYKNP
jgi:hypothetical protein